MGPAYKKCWPFSFTCIILSYPKTESKSKRQARNNNQSRQIKNENPQNCAKLESTKTTRSRVERIFIMRHFSTMNSNIKRGILRFSEKISTGLTRPDFKFITQMVYGILSAQSCHLSEISRALHENIALKKTIERLSRHLNTFSDEEILFDNYIKKIKGIFSGRTILIIDGSDITKPCSPNMEYISRIRDGSTGEYGDGYYTLVVTALTPERKMPIGVYTKVYSTKEPGFISEDTEVLNALDFISKHFKKGNIRAFDRGYDANIYYERLIDQKEAFIIRAKKNRNVIHKGQKINILALTQQYKGKYCLKFQKKNGKKVDCKISIVPVSLPCRPDIQLNLVICRGFGQEPLMLLTNLHSDDKQLSVVITKVYLLRWRIEEFYRFKKQQLDFEGFRVRSIKSIRNLDMLVTIAIGYIGLISEKSDERLIVMELIQVSKRIFGTPKFVFYAIADGLFFVCAKSTQSLSSMLRKKHKDAQLSLIAFPGFFCSA